MFKKCHKLLLSFSAWQLSSIHVDNICYCGNETDLVLLNTKAEELHLWQFLKYLKSLRNKHFIHLS